MDRRVITLVVVAVVSSCLTLVLRRLVFAEASWWPVLMIALLATALGLLVWRHRMRGDW